MVIHSTSRFAGWMNSAVRKEGGDSPPGIEWGHCSPIHPIVLVRYHHGILFIEKVGTHAGSSKWKLS